ncbi:hypothetical protein HETIRDRAFT_471885 [Heterobasidion irregulare TC 32-1]|uniref:NACHT domain-containing protein n=1 Tax=Heterobasidion irregulare (strain TC 32-1) TaxID=747525 RepID=W4KEZ2_HETIT|nr:uncharacterized protein HETIRDRAFT_471885 [Heterobasidion irregulare TC 32-1]ETW83636.1 hypothetical protein HETIRDRAFT_471885 [Heterobasidion irregulare TC 32-1]
MLYVANECLDLPITGGAEDLVETIGHISLQVASLIDEYIKLPFAVHSLRDTLSNNMKERGGLLQTRCRNITEKLGRRMNIDVNLINGLHALRLEGTLAWLNAPDPSKNYNNARQRHADGTCTWFLTGKEFSEWKKSARSLLWVHGIPGCGKTILCSSAIEDVSKHCVNNPLSAVAYYFFGPEDAQDDLRRYSDLLRCLIKQLLLQCNIIPHGLEQTVGSAQPSEKSLLEALELLLVQFKDVYVVLDSLDECTERESVLAWLQRILRWEAFEHKIHILVSSRDELGIRRSLELLHVVQACIQGKSVDDDIRTYIDRTLQTDRHMQRWNDTTKEEIRKHVLEISKGMFRLAALQLEELRSCHDIDELKLRLGQLPRKLYETYDHILSKLDPVHRQTALRVLQWLALSARPPRLIELPEYVAVDFEAKPYPRSCEDMRYNLEDILVICSNLIIVTVEGNVQLVHPSVKDYILTSTSLQNFGFTTNEKSSHSLIAQTCLAYLLQFETTGILTEDTLDNFPLAQYAANYWVSHAHAGTGDGRTDPLNTLTYTLFTGNDAPFVAWVRLNDLDRPGSKRDMKRVPIGSRLYYACLAGLQDLSSALLDAGEDPNAKGFDDCIVLQVAARSGQSRAVQHLLEKGAVINAPFGGQHGSALRAASSEGFGDIVRLLLEKGAEVNAESERYGTALQAAALEGHGEIVKLLLENGAEVNMPQEPCGSALQAAASRGHESIVQLLLVKGAEVNKQSQEYGDALQAASTGGHEHIVRLLLENGADVDARGMGPYQSALQAASKGNNQAIVELLLEKGADPVDDNAEGTHRSAFPTLTMMICNQVFLVE